MLPYNRSFSRARFAPQYEAEYETSIDPSSQEFRDNYIDNFNSYQMTTPDSTADHHYFKIFFANGKQRKFELNEVPGNMPAKLSVDGVTYYNAYIGPKVPDGYVKDENGLIFPTIDGQVRLNSHFTPYLTNLKTKVVVWEQHFLLMQVINAYSGIIGNYSDGPRKDFKVIYPKPRK